MLLSELIAAQTPLGHFQILKTIENRNVKINGARVGSDVGVQKGDIVYVYIRDREKDVIEIVFSDKNVLVANKPAGIEVEGDGSLTEKLNGQLEEGKVTPVHRLDRNTMGLVVFALNKTAEAELTKIFADRDIDKLYHAVVVGQPKGNAELKDFLFKDAKKSQVYISPTAKTGYMPIQTNYKTLKRANGLALLEVKLITGRTHQIRAHLAYYKLPILGDGKYGVNITNKKYGVLKQLLACVKVTFRFEQKSPLFYLNNKSVEKSIDLMELAEKARALKPANDKND